MLNNLGYYKLLHFSFTWTYLIFKWTMISFQLLVLSARLKFKRIYKLSFVCFILCLLKTIMLTMKINEVLDLKGVEVTYPEKCLDFSVCFCVTLVFTVLKLILKCFSFQLLCKLALKECYRRLPQNKMWTDTIYSWCMTTFYSTVICWHFWSQKRKQQILDFLKCVHNPDFFIFHPIKKTVSKNKELI